MNLIKTIFMLISALAWSFCLFLWIMMIKHTIKIVETINIAPDIINKQLIVCIIFTSILLLMTINFVREFNSSNKDE